MKSLLALFIGVLVIAPTFTQAKYIEADVQCPPGGQVNQPCKDNTNGYTTSGHCTHIYVCKADNYSGNPKLCQPGSKDCPVGGPYPSYPPHRAPIMIATGSPEVPPTSISNIEQNVLNSVFGSDTLGEGVDLEKIAADANAQLKALQTEPKTDGVEFLDYSKESFDAKTSALYSSLKDSAIMLQPGRIPGDTAKEIPANVRLAYASGGSFFGGTPYSYDGESGDSSLGAELTINAADAPRLLAKAVNHALRGIGNVFLADFTAAEADFALAKTEILAFAAHVGRAFAILARSLWAYLMTLI